MVQIRLRGVLIYREKYRKYLLVYNIVALIIY